MHLNNICEFQFISIIISEFMAINEIHFVKNTIFNFFSLLNVIIEISTLKSINSQYYI